MIPFISLPTVLPTLLLAQVEPMTTVGNLQLWLTQLLSGIEHLGAIAPIGFAALYIVATVACLPGSVLTLGAGVVFGVAWGTVYVFVAATLGAIAAFLVGRYLARDWVVAKIAGNPKFAAIDQAVEHEGFKIVVLTRLSPVFPFNVLNYAYGVTSVSLRDYAIGSIGMLPGTMMYVYIGSLAGSLATIGADINVNPQAAIAQRLLQTIGLIATIAVTIYITKIARKALDVSVNDLPAD